ncbi:MAG TPA: hypothetical protein VD966_09695 [Pyrinomonadaceae bacterium]|nr:hypothetical protein [Pyrinomonadaceae bacterium]
MSELGTLIWLKWTLFRNSMRSRKALASSLAATLGTLAALAFALLIALGLGVAAYGVASLDSQVDAAQPPIFFLFTMFALIYLMWATVPLSIGGGSQFDPGRLLLYPISLRKLFALDLLSELTSLASIFALPAVFALAVGAGLRNENVLMALGVALCAAAFGIALAKLLATMIGALMRKRRTRGETLLALVGVIGGLAGALAGQLTEVITRRGGVFTGLRWTPPGAAAVALMSGLRKDGAVDYVLALLTLLAYTFLFIAVTYWVARRAALGMGGAKRASVRARVKTDLESYTGWHLPFISSELSAIIEKELRYAMRNAQLRMMALMPLILIALRLMQTSAIRGDDDLPPVADSLIENFAHYGEGLLAAAGVLYVFTILSSLACNLFAYEGSGMRALVLAPVDRRTILVGKNIAITFLALVFSVALIVINQVVFRDLSLQALVFTGLCFVLFSAAFSLIGNWFSMRFPKPLQFGKRMNISGVAGLLLIPILIGMAIPPLAASVAGYLARSLVVKYATLTLFTGAAVMLYCVLIKWQGRALTRRQFDILEAVSGQPND